MAIFEITKGGITRQELLSMPFDEYQETVELTQQIIKKQNEAMNGGGR